MVRPARSWSQSSGAPYQSPSLNAISSIAAAAYRSIEPNIGSDIIALASALTANPLFAVAAELVAPEVQEAADKVLLAGATQTAVDA